MGSIILVIENNKETAEFVSELLKLEGYHVGVAWTGKAGLEMINRLKPDLILCEVAVPEIDGYGVLHVLNKDPVTAKIPFIFLTAKITKEDFRKGMNLGADDYISKPFDCTDLLNAIDVRLKKYELMKNNFDGPYREREDWQEKGPKELSRLFESGLKRHYCKKDFLFTVGESQHYLYFITKGEVKVSNTDENGKEMIFDLIGDGRVVGYKSLLNGSVHTENAVALVTTEVMLVKAHDFLQLIYSNREMAKWFISNLSSDLVQREQRLLTLAYQSVRQKVAATLVQVYEHQRLLSEGNLLISLSRKNLAAMVGTAIESLNRTILDFRKEGIIEITPRGILIVKMNKLAQIFRQSTQLTEMIHV